MRAKESKFQIDSPVARRITDMVNASERPQREIAKEIGYDKANIITMFKQGVTKVPIGKAAALARACDADPTEFVKLCLREYMPDAFDAIGEIFQGTTTPEEAKLLQHIRQAVKESGSELSLEAKKMPAFRKFIKENLIKVPQKA